MMLQLRGPLASSRRAAPAPRRTVVRGTVAPVRASEFCAAQLAFLKRKELYQRGEGPAMPDLCKCPTCDGMGTLSCRCCLGSGVNRLEAHEILAKYGAEDGGALFQHNGLSNLQFLFIKGGPCWLCRGRPESVGCKDCEGTGISGFSLENYSGD